MPLDPAAPTGRRAALLAMLCAAMSPAMAGESSCPDSAQAFWRVFRMAALNSDLETVADLTKFPLEVNSSLDDGGKRAVARARLSLWWPVLLKADPGLSAEINTMQAHLQAHPRLQDSFCTPGGQQFRVGEWVFLERPEGWRWVIAYINQ